MQNLTSYRLKKLIPLFKGFVQNVLPMYRRIYTKMSGFSMDGRHTESRLLRHAAI